MKNGACKLVTWVLAGLFLSASAIADPGSELADWAEFQGNDIQLTGQMAMQELNGEAYVHRAAREQQEIAALSRRIAEQKVDCEPRSIAGYLPSLSAEGAVLDDLLELLETDRYFVLFNLILEI